MEPTELAQQTIDLLQTEAGEAAEALADRAGNAAVDAAAGGAARVWVWLKSRFTGSDANVVTDAEAEPDADEHWDILRGKLTKRLKADPGLAADLQRLLAEIAPDQTAGGTHQTAAVKGRGNTTTQVGGSSNKVTITR
ncbi:MAG: hypothetical protein AAF561_02750 [Planctomycetota bacterium]